MTRNNTSMREKGRAVVLAALMVLSVVAMSAAFAGGAAASDDDGVTFDSQATTGDSVEVTLSGIDDAERLVIENSNGDKIADVSVSADVEGDTISVQLDEPITEDTLDNDYTAYYLDADGNPVTDSGGNRVEATATLSLYDDATDVDQSAVEFYNHDDSTNQIEIVYAGGDFSQLNTDQIEVNDRNGNSVGVDDVSVTNDRSVLIDISSDLRGEATVTILGVEHDVETTSTTIQDGNDEQNAYVGENVAIVGSSGDTVEIEKSDETLTRGLGDSSIVRTLDTSSDKNAPGDQINVTFSESTGTVSLTLEDLGLVAYSEEDSYYTDQEVTFTVEANTIDEDIDINVLDSDGDVVDEDNLSKSVTLNNDGQYVYTFDASVAGTGGYDIEAVHVDSGIRATSAVAIEERPDIETDASFSEDKVTEERGDVLNFDIDFENASEQDSVYVTIEEDEYFADLEIDIEDFEGDSATISWNTYNAGQSSSSTFWADNESVDVTVEDEFEIPNENVRLASGAYGAHLYQDSNRDNRVDTSTLIVEDRSTGKIKTSIAPQDSWDSDDREAVLDEISSSSDVATGDIAVFGIDVSGIYGYALDGNSFDSDSGVSLTFTEQSNSQYADVDNFTASEEDGVKLVANEDDNRLYAVVLTDEVDQLDVDETWTAEFEVSSDNDYVAEDEDETADTAFSILERSVSLDTVEDPYNVTPTEDAEIRGSTTLAPGSVINVEIDVESGNTGVYRDDQDVNVTLNNDSERVFVYQNDLSDRSVGEEGTITVTADDGDIEVTKGLIFSDTPEWETYSGSKELQDKIDSLEEKKSNLEDQVASLEEENADLEDKKSELEGQVSDLENQIADLQSTLDEKNSTISDLEDEIAELEDDSGSDETGSSGGDDSDDGDDSNGEDGQPGFGVAVALVALLAAAMLALRRQH